MSDAQNVKGAQAVFRADCDCGREVSVPLPRYQSKRKRVRCVKCGSTVFATPEGSHEQYADTADAVAFLNDGGVMRLRRKD